MFYEFLGLAFSNIIQAVVRTNTHNLCILEEREGGKLSQEPTDDALPLT